MAMLNLGISSCLAGHDVRWDGSNRFNDLIADTFNTDATLIPVCPEVECGLGVPREPMELYGSSEEPRLVTTQTRRDRTLAVREWSIMRSEELETVDLSGFIFKSGSPSCGIERVRVSRLGRKPLKRGVGLFAKVFKSRLPLVPVTDEKLLLLPERRMGFVENIFLLRRFRYIISDSELEDFHASHRLMLSARSQGKTRVLDKLVMRGAAPDETEILTGYTAILLNILKLGPTRLKNKRTLEFAVKLLRHVLSSKENKELARTMEEYGEGRLSFAAVLSLLGHLVQKCSHEDLIGQFFINRHPLELKVMEDM